MEYLRKELLTVSNELRKMMREKRYNKNYYLLRTIPVIGPLTAASILVEIGDVHRFETFYHLNSFVGLLPISNFILKVKKNAIITQLLNICLILER